MAGLTEKRYLHEETQTRSHEGRKRKQLLEKPSRQEITGSPAKKAAFLALYLIVLAGALFLLWKGGIALVDALLK